VGENVKISQSIEQGILRVVVRWKGLLGEWKTASAIVRGVEHTVQTADISDAILACMLLYPSLLHNSEVESEIHYTAGSAEHFWAVMKSQFAALMLQDGFSSEVPRLSPVFLASPALDSSYLGQVDFTGKSCAIAFSNGRESHVMSAMAADLAFSVTQHHIAADFGVSRVSDESAIQLQLADLSPETHYPFNDFEWAQLLPKEHKPFTKTPSRLCCMDIIIYKLCLAAKLAGQVDYILTGDELDAHNIYQWQRFPYVALFGYQFGMTQSANNLINALFLKDSKTKLFSPVWNLSYSQIFAINVATGRLPLVRSCWDENGQWCNACGKCFYIALMHRLFGQPLPEGLLPEPEEAMFAQTDDLLTARGLQVRTDTDRIGSAEWTQILRKLGKPVSGTQLQEVQQVLKRYPSGFLAPFETLLTPNIFSSRVNGWILNQLHEGSVCPILSELSTWPR